MLSGGLQKLGSKQSLTQSKSVFESPVSTLRVFQPIRTSKESDPFLDIDEGDKDDDDTEVSDQTIRNWVSYC